MGNFYTNITLRGPNLDPVLAYLDAEAIVAYAAAPEPGYVVVYDQASESQDETILQTRAAQLSRAFTCPALAVLNHDDDVLACWLYENGTQTDAYNSTPGWAEGDGAPPSGGDAAALCRVFGVDAVRDVTAILNTPASAEDNGYLFAIDRHLDLAAALHLPGCAVGFGFNYLDQGETPDNLTDDDLWLTGPED